jgi:hypothetical protein
VIASFDNERRKQQNLLVEVAMPNFSAQTAVVIGVTGFLLMTTAVGLLASADAQSAKAKPKPQAAGQIICTAQGCRPVTPGCRIETSKNAHGGGGQGQTELCN